MYLNGQQFRAGIGVTTVLPEFDFETYSEAGLVFDPLEENWKPLPGLGGQQRGLKGCGVRNYVQHPSFRILSLAWDLKDGKGKRWWRPPELVDLFPATQSPHYTVPADLLAHVANGGLLEAWNSGFEWQVWEFYCVPVLGWPRLRLEQMRCAMAKAKASALPAPLAAAGEVVGVDSAHLKDPKGKALIRKLTMPRNLTKKDKRTRWTPETAPADFEKFYQYNVQDIVAEEAVSLKVPDLTPRELRIWLMDQRINARGMGINRQAVENCIVIVEQARAREHARLSTLTNGQVKKSTEVAETLRWLGSRGIHLYNLDEDTVEEVLTRKDYPADVLEVVRIRQKLAFGSVNKLYKLRAQTTPQGRLHDQYSYHGAHTSLWNGVEVQPANFYSGIFDKPEQAQRALDAIALGSLEWLEYCFPGHDALEIVASCLRSLICAPEGSRLISADFTAIQAVVLAALAGEEWRLEVFRTHGKIYETTASKITGVPFEEIVNYPKHNNGKKHPHRQPYGKIPELSAGFGSWIGGWKQFGAGEFFTDDEIKQAILKWRADSPMVVELWGGQTRDKFSRDPMRPERPELYGLEGAAIAAVLAQRDDGKPGEAFGYRGITYQCFEDVLYCTMPSGGMLRYHAPRLQRSERPYASPWELELSYEGWNTNSKKGRPNTWERMKLYGGVLTQNVDAHESREIQADCLMALEDNGYPIVMHTHDEGVAEVINGVGSKEHYTQVARASFPSWAKTPDGQRWPVQLPTAWECQMYGKWEL